MHRLTPPPLLRYGVPHVMVQRSPLLLWPWAAALHGLHGCEDADGAAVCAFKKKGGQP